MSFNSAPVSQRTHIAFFGCTNSGKSSLINAIASQNVSLVSEIKGTTTDPVKKTMEILPLGAVVLFDTAGIDDTTELGKLRIEKTYDVLSKTDIAILVVDSTKGLLDKDNELIELFKNKKTPYIIAFNKSDLIVQKENLKENEIYVSAKTNENIFELKEKIANLAKNSIQEKKIVSHLLNKDDCVILVIPIDESAPKGRLILPQQQVIRDILDNHSYSICTQVEQLQKVLDNLKNKPKLVITDSQAFNEVSKIVPEDILLTSFSILFANYKGDLKELIKGVQKISSLKDDDVILIAEACTHHRQCNDIGSVKIPNMLKKATGKNLKFEFNSGNDFDTDLSKYALIVHCGACMLNEKQMQSRLEEIKKQGANVVNYGVLLAYLNGILDRSIEIFKY